MTTWPRLAGALILLGVLFALIWRMAVAPAVLGDFDPTEMPHRERAFLSFGNVGTAALFCVALFIIHRWHAGTPTARLAQAGAVCAAIGALAALLATIGLIWTNTAIYGLAAFVVLSGAAWAMSGYATFRRSRGVVGWTALLAGTVYALAAAAVFAGAYIVFIMTLATLPFAIALIACDPAARQPEPNAPSPSGAQ
jgi:hypothetical protein